MFEEVLLAPALWPGPRVGTDWDTSKECFWRLHSWISTDGGVLPASSLVPLVNRGTAVEHKTTILWISKYDFRLARNQKHFDATARFLAWNIGERDQKSRGCFLALWAFMGLFRERGWVFSGPRPLPVLQSFLICLFFVYSSRLGLVSKSTFLTVSPWRHTTGSPSAIIAGHYSTASLGRAYSVRYVTLFLQWSGAVKGVLYGWM